MREWEEDSSRDSSASDNTDDGGQRSPMPTDDEEEEEEVIFHNVLDKSRNSLDFGLPCQTGQNCSSGPAGDGPRARTRFISLDIRSFTFVYRIIRTRQNGPRLGSSRANVSNLCLKLFLANLRQALSLAVRFPPTENCREPSSFSLRSSHLRLQLWKQAFYSKSEKSLTVRHSWASR